MYPEMIYIPIVIAVAIFHLTKSNTLLLTKPERDVARLFQEDSTILDFPTGDLGSVNDILIEDDVIFVMYYAPWSRRCKSLKKEFENAARHFINRVQFVAINCWWPQGDCRQRTTFFSYPTFVFYHTTLNGFTFKGPYRSDHIIIFIDRLLYPLKHLPDVESIDNFKYSFNSAVMGFFDFNASPQPPGFYQFYIASMRTIENDHVNTIPFGVVSSLNKSISGRSYETPHLQYYSSCNETRIYPILQNISASSIKAWISSSKRQCGGVKWYIAAERKSLNLARTLSEGPTLFLFTQNYSLTPTIDHIIFEKISKEYYSDCDSGSISGPHKERSSLMDFSSVQNFMKLCQNFKNNDTYLRYTTHSILQLRLFFNSPNHCCMSYKHNEVPNTNFICNVCVESLLPYSVKCRNDAFSEMINNLISNYSALNSCVSMNIRYDSIIHLCCYRYESYTPKLSSPFKDEYIQSVFDRYRQCSNSISELSSGNYTHNSLKQFSGIGCRTNNSLNFVFVDKYLNSALTQHLGLDHDLSFNESIPVIIDLKNENIFSMNDIFNEMNIKNFIMDFTIGNLKQHLVSKFHSDETWHPRNEFNIKELNTFSFPEIISLKGKDVLVYFYTPWCGFCAAFSPIFLRLVRYFKSLKNLIFARINVDTNDLPWEFKLETIPALILFSSDRRASSVVYPKQAKSLSNLIKFILKNSNPLNHDYNGVIRCSRKCINFNRKRSAYSMNNLSYDIKYLQDIYTTYLEKYKSISDSLFKVDSIPVRIRLKDNTEILLKYLSILKCRIKLKKILFSHSHGLYALLKTVNTSFLNRHKVKSIIAMKKFYGSKVNTLQQYCHLSNLNIYSNVL